ncbi:MAG: Co2+/Mg2+ efflux protein ApaG [Proteobacteria bacterium]|nr:Co2+/Mg2+ efflux protein ApaG [Pseudomonadota bacterium]
MPDSEAVTQGVRVTVRSQYLPQHSSPQAAQWVFAYTVRITNEGSVPVKLLTRHWVITDGEGTRREGKGPGVVGAQPRLEPGQAFEYTSGCPLPTPAGEMHGTYQMVTDGGDAFDAEVAAVELSEPLAFN